MSIGEKIKAMRKAKGMTQKQLAEKIGVVPSTITKYEKDSLEPNLETLASLCEVLGMQFEDFLNLQSKDNRKIVVSIGGPDKLTIRNTITKEIAIDSLKKIILYGLDNNLILKENSIELSNGYLSQDNIELTEQENDLLFNSTIEIINQLLILLKTK